MALSISPLHRKFGAEVAGLDLARPISGREFAEVLDAFHAYSVLLFRGQRIDDAAQVRFSRRFGPLEARDFAAVGEHPNVYRFSNLGPDGRTLPRDSDTMTFLAVNERWHTDSSFKPRPALASLLAAKRVPPSGGDTAFASMRVAWAELPASRRRALDALRATHSYAYSRSLFAGRGAPDAEVDALPPSEHPLVRRHAPTGERSLYLSGHICAVKGLPEREGRALVDELIAFTTRRENVYRHRWRVDDLIVWDNRCVLHRALGFPERDARVMHRTTVAGDGPVR